ncbi:VagD [Salmonella enterica subsp. houtenae serovar 50:g,z51:- str. 01-0133]|nr:VagD [Salmonella enterica subsp. houtenae serovar 50:g,z51:- str. 01-0133]
MARRGFFARTAKTHFGVGNRRHHNTMAAQHCLFKVFQHSFRLLTHNERTDAGIQHVGFTHSSKRPSSLTMSSRSVRKSGLAFSSWRNEPQEGRAGRRIIVSPSRKISSSLTPSKSRSRGRRIARLLPFLNTDTVRMVVSCPCGRDVICQCRS